MYTCVVSLKFTTWYIYDLDERLLAMNKNIKSSLFYLESFCWLQRVSG